MQIDRTTTCPVIYLVFSVSIGVMKTLPIATYTGCLIFFRQPVYVETRQSEMANTSPRHMPVLGRQPRWLSGLRRSHVHSLMIARRSLCPEKLGSNPGQGSKGINFSGWYDLDMSITVTKSR